MGKRQVFERQVVDSITGEVASEEVHWRSDNNETFGMHRTTEGSDWVFDFTGNELKMLIVLLEIEDLKTGIVPLSRLTRTHLVEKFGKSDRYVRGILSALEGKNGLIKLSRTDILLNPSYFYQGGTKMFNRKLEFYIKERLKAGFGDYRLGSDEVAIVAKAADKERNAEDIQPDQNF